MNIIPATAPAAESPTPAQTQPSTAVRVPVAVLIVAIQGGSQIDTFITVARIGDVFRIDGVATPFEIPAQVAADVADAIRAGTPRRVEFGGHRLDLTPHGNGGVIVFHIPPDPDTASHAPSIVTLRPVAAAVFAAALAGELVAA